MEVEADPNLLVVNLEHCVSSETRQFGKSSCIYTTTMPPNSCGHDVLQLTTPVQCLGDINQPLSRIQHQHLTHLQPLQYPQVQVSYDNGSLQQPSGSLLTGGASLYQAPPTAALHHYHPPPPGPPVSAPPSQTFHGGYLTPLSVAPTPSMQDYPPIMPAPAQQNLPENLPPQNGEATTSIAPSVVAASSHEKQKKEYLVEPEPLPSDDYQYYKEIERFLATNELPANASPLYNKRLRKRAQNYTLIDGVLHHNPKEPRRVIMTKEEQAMLLEPYHISTSSGVHIGIKKMFAKLRDEFFWRGMYVSVATYVRKCTRCSDSAPIPMPPVISNSCNQEDSCPQTSGISTGVQTASRIWTDVEIQLCGPYKTTNNRNSHIAVIVDPESKFLLAAALPSSGLVTRLTQFMMTNLFSFGFARAHLVISMDLYSAVHDEFSRRTRDLRDCQGLLRRRDKPSCGWVNSLLALLVDKKPHRWDRELDKFLYQFRTGEMKQFVRICASDEDCIGTVCPFYSMFQRPPCPLSAATSSEDKENSFPISTCKTKLKRKKETSKTILCQQSVDSMMPKSMSASSQKETLHNSNVIESEKDDDTLDKQVNGNTDTPENMVETTKETNTFEPVHMAVSSIKTYLSETRVARQRRGNYNKYPDELRERMASYALKHGSQEAAKHFSTVLGIQVNDSTIRNLVKSRTRFGLAQRQEIAKYAIEKGVSEAAKHFSSTLNVTISHYLIRRFISLYGPKRPHCKKNRNKMKKDAECLTVKVKNDIGSYANEHSFEETISHFRNLLGIHLMESAVKKLHEDYLHKHPSTERKQREQHFVKQEAVASTYNEQNTVCFSQADTNVVSQNSYYSNVHMYQSQFPAVSCPGRPPETAVGESENSGVSQPFLLVPQENSSSYDIGMQEKVKNNWVNSNTDEGNNVYQQYPSVNEQIFVEVVSDKNNTTIENTELVSTTQDHQQNQSEKVVKKTVIIKKRGKYSTFSPEFRAEIGKYAVEHGCLKASQHFASILGRDLPESTARGIKEKYLKKLKYTDVTSLGYSPRGRAPLLGKYDEIVQDCLKELIKTGERASSFLAIITARKILNKYEPSLLKENGGNVELNNSWAKSFLKRLGLRNNS